LPEYRIHLWDSLAALALRTGHPYWGWRFAGWAMHYLQDLTQPYHARVLPGVGVAGMLWINTLDLAGIHRPKADAIALVTNRHLALENYQLRWLRDAYLRNERSDAALEALGDTSRDARNELRERRAPPADRSRGERCGGCDRRRAGDTPAGKVHVLIRTTSSASPRPGSTCTSRWRSPALRRAGRWPKPSRPCWPASAPTRGLTFARCWRPGADARRCCRSAGPPLRHLPSVDRRHG
jgi:hypothetical protein